MNIKPNNETNLLVVNHNQNKSTLVTPHEETKYQAAQNFLPWSTKPTTPTPSKKTSSLFSPLGFLKKKKVDDKGKRLSLMHISNKKSVPAPNRNSSSSVLTPPSPMFSQMDFYYSPSDNHHHNDLPSPHIC